jgi:hypothetical protein
MAFLDLEKAFDRVDRNMVWQVLNRRGFPHHLIKTIESLYKNTSIQINTGKKILGKFVINQGLRQGCSLSPTLFNIYMDDLLRKSKLQVNPGIILKTNLAFSTLLFADDHLIIQDSKDKLQKSIHLFNLPSKDYNLKISISETKVMAFKGKHIVRSKIMIDGSILAQVKQFNYLGCKLNIRW